MLSRNCPLCVCSFIIFLLFLLKEGGGDGERLKQLPAWIHKLFKLQYLPSTLYTLRTLLRDMLFSYKYLRVCVRTSSHKHLSTPNTLVFESGFRYVTCMPLLMFEDMYFTILGTYFVTEPRFVTSAFTLMGLSCVYIIIIIKAVQDIYMLGWERSLCC